MLTCFSYKHKKFLTKAYQINPAYMKHYVLWNAVYPRNSRLIQCLKTKWNSRTQWHPYAVPVTPEHGVGRSLLWDKNMKFILNE